MESIINLLPESCLAHVLSLTTPRDVCRSSLTSPIFRSAAESNVVWDRFLPSDYQEIVSRLSSPVAFSSKKELYFHLCNPVHIDGGKMTFSLERSTGKKCYMMSARELVITWGNDPMYWTWKPLSQSRFSEVVELRTICWLEIHGKINRKMLSPETNYGAYLIVKVSDRAYGLDSLPSELSVEVGNQRSRCTAYLCHRDVHKQSLEKLCFSHRIEVLSARVIDGEHRVPCWRDDGWMEIELGEFLNNGRGGGGGGGGGSGGDGEVKMSLMEPSINFKYCILKLNSPLLLACLLACLLNYTRDLDLLSTISKINMDGGVVDFNSLPEDCISTIILLLTNPRDLCRSSLVSSTFRSLADSNIAWDRFLPSDYQEILSSSVSPVQFSTSKDLYFRLCNSILIDGVLLLQSFSLDASTGKTCYMLSARDLSITWGNEPMYWCWKSIPQSRFSEVVELGIASWLQINGKISSRLLSHNTTYAAYLVVNFANRAYGLDKIPSEITVELGTHVSRGTVYLRGKDGQGQPLDGLDHFLRSSVVYKGDGMRVPVDRKDGWMEIELGEFFIDDGDEGEVKMSLMEVEGEHLKGGLIVEGIEVRPKVVKGL
ncbi:F-box domain [Macleaya cordata]|uniref:F-box domain n=1 Tax=Macleaya cordata TaxID=56857 RepID=A0A200QSK4_MACCD|nr:F-box domain [Macleaya cordata]